MLDRTPIRENSMRTLRLLVFCVAFSLVAGSVTTAAVRADDGASDAEQRAGDDSGGKSAKDDAKDGKGRGRDKSDDQDGKGRGRGDEDRPEHPLGGPPGQLPVKPGDADAVVLPDPPALGQTLGARPNAGTVKVKLPGADEFTELDAAETIPMRSTVDATDGLVEIVVQAGSDGTRQNAVVTGAQFAVDQLSLAPGEPAVTDLVLKGGDFSDCDRRESQGGPTARAASRNRRRGRGDVVRGLWAAAKGNFRTRGRHSAATVRGTRWAIVDRCNSTTVKVFDGVVDVMDFDLDKVFTVRAGERHVARPPRR